MITLVGWVGVLLAVAALTAFAIAYVAIRRGRRDQPPPVRLGPFRTLWLLAMWLLLLAGSAGLLMGSPSGVLLLRLWMVMLAAWTAWYLSANLASVYGMDEAVPGAFRNAARGAAVVALLVAAVLVGMAYLLTTVPA